MLEMISPTTDVGGCEAKGEMCGLLALESCALNVTAQVGGIRTWLSLCLLSDPLRNIRVEMRGTPSLPSKDGKGSRQIIASCSQVDKGTAPEGECK